MCKPVLWDLKEPRSSSSDLAKSSTVFWFVPSKDPGRKVSGGLKGIKHVCFRSFSTLWRSLLLAGFQIEDRK